MVEVSRRRARQLPDRAGGALACSSGWLPRKSTSPAAAIATPSGIWNATNVARSVPVRVIARMTPG